MIGRGRRIRRRGRRRMMRRRRKSRRRRRRMRSKRRRRRRRRRRMRRIRHVIGQKKSVTLFLEIQNLSQLGAWGRCKRSPGGNTHFSNNLLKIGLKSGLWVGVYKNCW